MAEGKGRSLGKANEQDWRKGVDLKEGAEFGEV